MLVQAAVPPDALYIYFEFSYKQPGTQVKAGTQVEAGTQAKPDTQVESALAESVLSPDLIDLGKAIMQMPTEVKENLVSTIRMLVKTVSIYPI